MSVVQFDPPYRGQHVITHFPRMILAVDMTQHAALVMTEDGVLEVTALGDIQTDFRWNKNQQTWVSILEPDLDEGG